jgi:hypothetical protein
MFLTVLVSRVDNGFRMGDFVFTLSVETCDRHKNPSIHRYNRTTASRYLLGATSPADLEDPRKNKSISTS